MIKDLENYKVWAWELNDDKTVLHLNPSNSKSFRLIAYGDCCSESWFESIDLPDSSFTIKNFEEIKMEEVTGTKQEVDKIYSYKFYTDKGIFDVELRNSSNGYYGGSIDIYKIEKIYG